MEQCALFNDFHQNDHLATVFNHSGYIVLHQLKRLRHKNAKLHINVVKCKRKLFPSHKAYVAVVPISIPLDLRQTPGFSHRYRDSPSCNAPVYTPVFTGTHCGTGWLFRRSTIPKVHCADMLHSANI